MLGTEFYVLRSRTTMLALQSTTQLQGGGIHKPTSNIKRLEHKKKRKKDKLSIKQRQKRQTDKETNIQKVIKIKRHLDKETHDQRDNKADRQTDAQLARNQVREGSKYDNVLENVNKKNSRTCNIMSYRRTYGRTQ